MKFRNVSGDTLLMPSLGMREVAPDEVIDVPDALAAGLDGQSATWAPEVAPAMKKKES